MSPKYRLERIDGTSRTFDVLCDGIWKARITIDPFDGIHVRSGGLDAAGRLAVRLSPGYPFVVVGAAEQRAQ